MKPFKWFLPRWREVRPMQRTPNTVEVTVRGGLVQDQERKHGLFTEQFPVSAYVGSSKNLKDLKDQ